MQLQAGKSTQLMVCVLCVVWCWSHILPLLYMRLSRTVFACCEEPNHPVGGCMFKTRSATGSGSVQKDFDLSEKVGEFDAHW